MDKKVADLLEICGITGREWGNESDSLEDGKIFIPHS